MSKVCFFFLVLSKYGRVFLVFVVIVYDVFDENLRNDDGIVADKVFFCLCFLSLLGVVP